ncbi:MAG: hypothetical protein ACREGB_03230, partial [Candidatus Saccharimonadales bacterium]
LSSGGNVQAGVESGLEAVAFSYVGDQVTWGDTVADQMAKSVTEGIIGGVFTEAGGGRFGDGFLGAFASSELSSAIGTIGGNPYVNPGVYYSAANISARVVVSAVVGGTVASLTGGDFSDGAVAAAMQRRFNDEMDQKRFDEVTILGHDIDIGIEGDIPESEQVDIQVKLDVAIGDIDEHAGALSQSEAEIIQGINGITVNDNERTGINVQTGIFNLKSMYIEESSTAWLASVIGHDAYHVFQYQLGESYNPQTASVLEREADLFQIQVGKIFGLTPYEIEYIENDRHTFYNTNPY